MKFLRSPVSENSPQESSRQIEPVLVSGLISEIHFIFTSCFRPDIWNTFYIYILFCFLSIFQYILFVSLFVWFSVFIKKKEKMLNWSEPTFLVALHIYRTLGSIINGQNLKEKNVIKGSVSVISSYSPCRDSNADLQRYPWNLNLFNHVELISGFKSGCFR